eukprot:s3603_g2.t1
MRRSLCVFSHPAEAAEACLRAVLRWLLLRLHRVQVMPSPDGSAPAGPCIVIEFFRCVLECGFRTLLRTFVFPLVDDRHSAKKLTEHRCLECSSRTVGSQWPQRGSLRCPAPSQRQHRLAEARRPHLDPGFLREHLPELPPWFRCIGEGVYKAGRLAVKFELWLQVGAWILTLARFF